jgi:hypothetical protein
MTRQGELSADYLGADFSMAVCGHFNDADLCGIVEYPR